MYFLTGRFGIPVSSLILILCILTPILIHSGEGFAQSSHLVSFIHLFKGLCFAEKVFTPPPLELPLSPLTGHIHMYMCTHAHTYGGGCCVTLRQLYLKAMKFQIYIIKHTALTWNTSCFSPLPLPLLHQSLLSSASFRMITGLLRKL